ncbi:MAG: DNA-directed RNA polymerase subunit H [Candidatus Methanophagaceae archaeon]|nr:MAG: DNA-directed RNA polymerase subunit H [Methanophagales archaeon]
MKKTKVAESKILEHALVPKHEIMSEAEVKELLDSYKIRKAQLPKIKSSDPVCKEIKIKIVGKKGGKNKTAEQTKEKERTAEVGDIVKITRQSRTAGKVFSYRLVVE